jgi:hypothetical protein
MKTPGFNAEGSLYKTSGRYQATMYGNSATTGIVAQHYGPSGGCRSYCLEYCWPDPVGFCRPGNPPECFCI